MTEPAPTYQLNGRKPKPSPLPTWAVHLAYRAAQLGHTPGEYRFCLIITPDGRKRLEITTVKVEELGA